MFTLYWTRSSKWDRRGHEQDFYQLGPTS
jgi:hypothetical protein